MPRRLKTPELGNLMYLAIVVITLKSVVKTFFKHVKCNMFLNMLSVKHVKSLNDLYRLSISSWSNTVKEITISVYLWRYQSHQIISDLWFVNVYIIIFTPFDRVKTPTFDVLTIGFLSQKSRLAYWQMCNLLIGVWPHRKIHLKIIYNNWNIKCYIALCLTA